MTAIKTLLHPTDFSERSNFAFELACEVAHKNNAKIVVLHVATPLPILFTEGILPIEQGSYLDRLRERLNEVVPKKPKLKVEHKLVEGDAATEILRVASDINCDLIVMGTHGRTGLGRLLMGSVAEQVVRQAACPVLTLKTPLHHVSVSEEAELVGAGASAED